MALTKSIHDKAWPDVPFDKLSAASSLLDFSQDEQSAVLTLQEGERQALMMLRLVPLQGNSTRLMACETAWGATKPAPKRAAERIIDAAQKWAAEHGAFAVSICLGGDTKTADRFIKKHGGEILHTAGAWRL